MSAASRLPSRMGIITVRAMIATDSSSFSISLFFVICACTESAFCADAIGPVQIFPRRRDAVSNESAIFLGTRKPPEERDRELREEDWNTLSHYPPEGVMAIVSPL